MISINPIQFLKKYSVKSLKLDLFSGLIVSLISLPLAMSFAISAGLNPEYGLYAAIIGGAVTAIFGGSESNIADAPGNVIAIMVAVMIQFGYEGVLLATLMAGVILIFAAIFKVGQLVQFVPYPVILGFTGGIGVIIFSTQLGSIFGLSELDKFAYFHQNIWEFFSNIKDMSWLPLGMTALTIIFIEGSRRIAPKLPSALIGVVLTALIVKFFNLDILTIKESFGAIPQSLPKIQIPVVDLERVIVLFPAALAIAALGVLETLLTAIASDSMTGKKHNSNKELVGLGLGNIASALFGGISVCGVISRTTLNVKSGAQTRMAAVFKSVFLLIMMLLLVPLVEQIPLVALSGILVIVSVKMFDIEQIKLLYKYHNRTDLILLLITFLLTVFVSLTVGIAVGMIFAVLVFLQRMSEEVVSHTVIERKDRESKFVLSSKQTKCKHISIYTINVPLFFGTSRSIIHALSELSPKEALIIRLTSVKAMDATGMQALKEILDVHALENKVYLSGVNKDMKKMMKQTGVIKLIGEGHVFEKTQFAINKALKDQKLEKCCEAYKLLK
jgi:sulfate permease, SulP family